MLFFPLTREQQVVAELGPELARKAVNSMVDVAVQLANSIYEDADTFEGASASITGGQ